MKLENIDDDMLEKIQALSKRYSEAPVLFRGKKSPYYEEIRFIKDNMIFVRRVNEDEPYKTVIDICLLNDYLNNKEGYPRITVFQDQERNINEIRGIVADFEDSWVQIPSTKTIWKAQIGENGTYIVDYLGRKYDSLKEAMSSIYEDDDSELKEYQEQIKSYNEMFSNIKQLSTCDSLGQDWPIILRNESEHKTYTIMENNLLFISTKDPCSSIADVTVCFLEDYFKDPKDYSNITYRFDSSCNKVLGIFCSVAIKNKYNMPMGHCWKSNDFCELNEKIESEFREYANSSKTLCELEKLQGIFNYLYDTPEKQEVKNKTLGKRKE